MTAPDRRGYSFENAKYAEKLTRCALHMDQGISYNPEYLATRDMGLYPSRVAQIIRAVWLGELAAAPRGAAMVFASILSGQGERWQSFGEDQDDFLHCVILGRELFSKKGFGPGVPKEALEAGESGDREALWARSIEVDPGGDSVLFVDDASFEYTGNAPAGLGEFLNGHGVGIRGFHSGSTGFALMAHGFADDGIGRLTALVGELNGSGAKKIITVSGQAVWSLTVLTRELGISRDFDVVDILDMADSIESDRAFLYGGSFYARFLDRSNLLASLSKNSVETPIPNSPEFLPLYNADKRLNGINIWERPIGSEYLNLHSDAAMLEKIRDSALNEINRSSCSQLIVCEPFAYNMLRETGFAGARTEYFWDVLR
jgi:hypothetical protein